MGAGKGEREEGEREGRRKEGRRKGGFHFLTSILAGGNLLDGDVQLERISQAL